MRASSILSTTLILFAPYTYAFSAEVRLSIDASTEFQTMEGFGAADQGQAHLLSNHPRKDDIYDLLFVEAGLSILRFGNNFGKEKADDIISAQFDTLNAARERMTGGLPKIMLSAWSPAASLKSNGKTKFGTLAKKAGKFVYEQYGEWWTNSLQWYASKGMDPEYVSIQNEPDWQCNKGESCWDGCHMEPTESSEYPSYSKALEAVSSAMTRAGLNYKLIGPETLSVDHVKKYAATMDLSLVWGVAHHDYPCENVDYCADKSKELRSDIKKPLMMTEFMSKGWLQTALILHNSLTVENVVAYLHWGIPWPMGKSGIGTRGHACSLYLFCLGDEDYTVSRMVYVLMQYARFVRPGWKRVQLSANSGDFDVRASAFKDPAGLEFAVVLINNANNETSVKLRGISIEGSVYQTSANQTCEGIGKYKPGDLVKLPGHSITTVHGYSSLSRPSTNNHTLSV